MPKHLPLSVHAQVARKHERVPSPDELKTKIDQKIAEEGHLRTINNATLTELD